MKLASITNLPACLADSFYVCIGPKERVKRFEEDLYECWNYHHYRNQDSGELHH
jgi:hypothetical protein